MIAIPVELVRVYIALGWRLVDEGCCGLARVMPPAALPRRQSGTGAA
jgi:hypothetical protein